jgi:hypothetical protein
MAALLCMARLVVRRVGGWELVPMAESPVEKLQRWELSGATWRVVRRSAGSAEVELCACTGELMERLTSGDPRLLEFLDARAGAEDGAHG